jgi:hypothetical protein
VILASAARSPGIRFGSQLGAHFWPACCLYPGLGDAASYRAWWGRDMAREQLAAEAMAVPEEQTGAGADRWLPPRCPGRSATS